jgi:hypothetical protein
MVCAALGISSGALTRGIADGTIRGRVGYGRYSAIEVVRSMVDSLTADLARADTTDDAAIWAARLRWFLARAGHSEAELSVRRGELLDAEEVTVTLQHALSVMRNRLMVLPTVLGPRLAMTNDTAKCAAAIRDAVMALLTEFSESEAMVVPGMMGNGNGAATSGTVKETTR